MLWKWESSPDKSLTQGLMTKVRCPGLIAQALQRGGIDPLVFTTSSVTPETAAKP